MASQDLHHNILTTSGLNIVQIVTNTTALGNIIDTKEYESLEFVIQAAIDDGLYSGHLYHGDAADLSDATEVSLDYLLGTPADTSFTPADTGETRRIGYVGHKRYVQLRINSISVTNGGYFGAVAILGKPHRAATPKEINL